MKSCNPSTGELLGTVTESTPDDVRVAVESSRSAYALWKNISLEKRIGFMRAVIAEIEARKEECAVLQSREMGMPIRESRADIDDAIEYTTWYCDAAAHALAPTTIQEGIYTHTIVREPVGVIASILPWNYPVGNIVWSTFQALLAGNTVIVKHSEECPLSGKLMEEICTKHLPKNVFIEIYGDGVVGEQLATSAVDMIAFTGSSKVGKKLYEIAGKKFVRAGMELGGSSPAIVLPDADIEEAASLIAWNRLINQGQRCVAAKRLIVPAHLLEEITLALIPRFARNIGDALDPSKNFGPLVAPRQVETLTSQVADAVAKGARVRCGGKPLTSLGGSFFEPTILTNITRDMRVWTEETFGPVLPIIGYHTDEEMIELANDTDYGLGAFVYGTSRDLYSRIAPRLQSGMPRLLGISTTSS
jgi:acyl-CoA reductase-like NAD-dependent aldehyde dehydrogenase